jgi:hypothetical protein
MQHGMLDTSNISYLGKLEREHFGLHAADVQRPQTRRSYQPRRLDVMRPADRESDV